MVMSFIYNRYGSMQANGVIHGEEWMSIRNDEMSKTISLYPIFLCFVCLVRLRSEQSF